MIITTIIILITITGNLNNKNDGLPNSICHTDTFTCPVQKRFPNN